MASNSNVYFPWSGAVDQAFDLMQSWFRNIGGQVGLVNITVGSTADPEMEKRIVGGVGSYGRQLGRISDALRVLVEEAEKSGSLKVPQKKALNDFLTQVEQVDAIKAKYH